MSARILHGRPIADNVLDALRERVLALDLGPAPPQLAFVMIGDSPPARVYVNGLERLGRVAGIAVSRHVLSADVSVPELDRTLSALNADNSVDGILVQMPLPDHLNRADLSGLMDARKDVDGITVSNAGRLYLGLAGQSPPTALAMMRMLEAADVCATGKHAVVIGRSNVVGHPVTEMLLQQDSTVTVTHRGTPNLADITAQADILMVGAGEAGLIRAHMVKPGVVIIDAGINVTGGGVVGDVAFEECVDVASAITPVPGGVGPVTNAMLLRNVVASAEKRRV